MFLFFKKPLNSVIVVPPNGVEQPVAAEAAQRVSYRFLSTVRGPAERER
jgi:hypothetical protein